MVEDPRIKAFARQFAIPVKMAREAFIAADGNYSKAFDWLKAKMSKAAGAR